MSPLFRSNIRISLFVAPLLSLACVASAKAAEEPVTPAPVVAAVSPAAFAVTPPASFALFPSPAAPEGHGGSSSSSDSALPNAPEPVAAPASNAFFLPSTPQGGVAKKYASSIEAGQTAQTLSVGNKVVLGMVKSVSPFGVVGTIVSSGYSHLENGQPNYGVDGDAFAQRFGAGMAKGASEAIFTTSILSPIFHQDTRYYVLGPQAPFLHRAMYVITRPFITRTDGGRNTVNASLLIGYAGAAALTRVYYPEQNRNFGDEARGYGTSLGGAAVGFAFDEFTDQLLRLAHLRH